MGWTRPATGRFSRAVRVTGITSVSLLTLVLGAYLLLPLAIRAVLQALDLALGLCIWLTTSLDNQAGVWTVASAVGRATASTLMTPRVLAAGGALVLVSALSLYGLQRLLDSNEEPR
jgi:hypothetical protein